MTPDTERFEIRIQGPTASARRYGHTDPMYVVWDTKLDQRIPCGDYRDLRDAEARVAEAVRHTAGRLPSEHHPEESA